MTLRYNIQQWLSTDGSFRDGVGFLEMAGSRASVRFRAVLQQPYVDSKQKEQLRKALIRLLAQLPEDHTPAPNVVSKDEAQKVPDTPRIKAIRKQARGLHKERSDLKSRLLVRGLDEPEKYSDAERLELAKIIMEENVPNLDELYNQIRRFEEEGIEPADDAQLIKEQTVAQVKKVYSLRPQISRLKGAIKKGGLSKKDLQEKQVELEEKESELEELEQLLGL